MAQWGSTYFEELRRVKINIDTDEYYPYRRPHRTGTEVDVPAGTVKRWNRVLAEHDKVQDEMAEAVKEARR